MLKRTRNLVITAGVLCLLQCAVTGRAQEKIKAYFSYPVDSSVATGKVAVYLPDGTMADTIVAYINRAKYTIDIAQYNYNQSSNYGSYASIAAAVNAAYARGVRIRWIYNGTSTNNGLSLLAPGIYTLGRPSGNGIMHHKFIVIDAGSDNAADAVVSTGSEDWSSQMMHKDWNNILFIQDSALARAYEKAFEQMWGSSTALPDSANARFGSAKQDLGQHQFYIDGKEVSVYFSPADSTNNKIFAQISGADKDLYFGLYTFTDDNDATAIINKHNAGVYVGGILDQYSAEASGGEYATLLNGLGSNQLMQYSGNYIYHNKMMIVDPSDSCSDPVVLTGSHNWTNSANKYNDEDIVIIHDATLANEYYQSFRADFTSLGGALSTVSGCAGTGAPDINSGTAGLSIYPNPSKDDFYLEWYNNIPGYVWIKVINMNGTVLFQQNGYFPAGVNQLSVNVPAPGIYFAEMIKDGVSATRKVVVE